MGYAIVSEIKTSILNTNVDNFTPAERSQLSNDIETISDCKNNLDILRSHLARHYTKSLSDSIDISNLDDSTAIVIADFKNKIYWTVCLEKICKSFLGKMVLLTLVL